MWYFYNVNVQTDKAELEFYLVGSKIDNSDNENPPKPSELTVEKVKSTAVYREFVAEHKINKEVWGRYTVYSTDEDLSPLETESSQKVINEKLHAIARGGGAASVCTSDIQIPPGKKTKAVDRTKCKNIKGKTPMSVQKMIPIILIVAIISGIFGFFGGFSLRNSDGESGLRDRDIAVHQDSEFAGLIMPELLEFDEGAELITVALDRSYFAVPREDIHLKGEVKGGVARITLPKFDRNDYFSHVPGHTWGWSTDPKAKKIQYHGGGTYEFTENVKLYRVLVKYGGGSGTKEDPYIINWYDQFSLMSAEKVRGYFKQTEDIYFPALATHSPINTVNELRNTPDSERFEYDGGGFIISGLPSPLFGRVSGSVLQNINIVEANISSLREQNYGFIVNEIYNFQYELDGEIYETGETLIKNCSVQRSFMELKLPESDVQIQTAPPATLAPVIPPDLELSDDELAQYFPPEPVKYGEFAIGAISGLGGQIENCYIEEVTIIAELDNYFLYVGGISGKPASVVNSGVANLSIEGKIFNAGGIAGSAGGSRLYSATGIELPLYYGGNIQGCFVRSFTAHVEVAAGGIAGEGGTNALNSMISNNYAAHLDFKVGVFHDMARLNPVKLGFSGGIIGSDGVERNGHTISNTVSDSCYPIIGLVKLSKTDDSVRVAQNYAFYQHGILDIINRNAVNPNNPGEIFTGSFVFTDGRNNDEGGNYAFPVEISGLIPAQEGNPQ